MEINELEKVLDAKLDVVRTEVKGIKEDLEKFISSAKWVAATIVIPILFFVLQKVF